MDHLFQCSAEMIRFRLWYLIASGITIKTRMAEFDKLQNDLASNNTRRSMEMIQMIDPRIFSNEYASVFVDGKKFWPRNPRHWRNSDKLTLETVAYNNDVRNGCNHSSNVPLSSRKCAKKKHNFEFSTIDEVPSWQYDGFRNRIILRK